jgi:Aldehyde dehydrogenase family
MRTSVNKLQSFCADVVAPFNAISTHCNMFVCTCTHVQIDDAQLQKILKLCESGKRDGAKCVLGGSRHITNDTKKGFYMQPTIFADVTDNMEVRTLVQSVEVK